MHNKVFPENKFYQENELEKAIRENRKSNVETLLEQNPELLESINTLNDTPLHYAVRCNHVSLVAQWYERYPEMRNKKNSDLENPCDLAVFYGHEGVFKFFLDKNPELLHEVDGDQEDKTIAHKVAESGHLELVAYVLERNPKLIHALDGSNQTILHSAVISFDVKTAELVMKKKPESLRIWSHRIVPPNEWREPGDLPIHWAIDNNDHQMLNMLLQYDPTLIDERSPLDQKETILHKAACACQNVEVIRTLLSFSTEDVNVNTKDKNGDTPLHHAVRGEGSPEIVACLLQHGAPVNEEDHRGNTPLHQVIAIDLTDHDDLVIDRAVCEKQRRLVTLLVEAGADLHKANQDGWTPYDLVASEDNPISEQLLVVMKQEQAQEEERQPVLYRPEATASGSDHGTEAQQQRKRKEQSAAATADCESSSSRLEKRSRHHP